MLVRTLIRHGINHQYSGLVTPYCVFIFGSGNGWLHLRRQDIADDDLSLIGPLGTKYGEIFVKMKYFSFKYFWK